MRTVLRRLAIVPAVVLALTACDAGTPTGMPGGRNHSGTPRPPAWPGGMGAMMGGTPYGYHFRTPSCTPPDTLPGSRVTVVVGDMGMMRMMGGVAPYGSHMMLRAMPSRVPAGQVSLVVANVGWRTHELVVLPLRPGHRAGQRVIGADGRVSEAGSLGEASATCAAGEGDGIRSGAAGWVTLTLPAGSYELVCNLRNHYRSGMRQQLTVE